MKKVLLIFIVSLGSSILHAQTLVAFYPFNGNANDASGNGNNGTVNGATLTTDRNGTANRAYKCISNQYIDLGNNAILKPTAGITFGGWFYRNSWTGASDGGMLSCTESAGYELFINSTYVQGWVHRNGAYATVNIPVASISSGWHSFMCTYDGRYTRIYMDGIQQADFNDAGATYPIEYISNNVIIGAEAGTTGNSGAEFFTGNADEIRIYNGALSPLAISTLYATTLPVHLQAFAVTNTGGVVLVNWSAENETDFSRYEIERSIDGINFITVSQVNAKPSNARNNYTVHDEAAKGSIYYYRLKMVNRDGTFSYSDIIKYTTTVLHKVTLYPNPVSDYFEIKGLENIQQIDILDLKGSLMKRFIPTADNRYRISSLGAGAYTVNILLKDKTTITTRLLK